jgi:conjugal transfer/type IV secretion protein DotA/TraY
MPDLKTLPSLALGLLLLMTAQAAAQGLPAPSDYGELFGTRTGDAYSSVLLNQMFGPLFPSAALPEGDARARTVFSSIIGYFNVIILVVGGLMFFYNVTVGVLQSSHEGQVLGQRWSSLWAPIRVLFAVGLLVPVPTYGGYNLAQVGVAYIVKGSTNIASEIWKGSVTLILDGDVPIATNEPRFSPDLIRTLYENAACINLLNYQYAAIGSPLRVEYSDASSPVMVRSNTNDIYAGTGLVGDATDGRFPRYTSTTQVVGGGAPENFGICGSWMTPDVPAYLLRAVDEAGGTESAAAQQIIDEFGAGHRDILIEVESRVRDLVTGSGDAAPVRQDVFDGVLEPEPFTQELIEISTYANQELSSLVSRLRARAQETGGASAYDDLVSRITGSCTDDGSGPAGTGPATCYGEGWIGAGAYYTTLARVNAEVNTLVTAQSSVSGREFGVILTQDRFVRGAGGTNLLGFRNSTGDLLPTEAEAARVMTDYMELFETSSYPLAALGYPVSTADIIEANAEAGDSSSGLLQRALQSLNEGLQRVQASILRYFDPANTESGDPMIGLISMGSFLISFGGALLLASAFGVRIAVMMVPFFSVIFAAGATLSFVLPLMPFFYWILGVTGYFLLVVEAIVAVNLWALAHMRMEGDGISGAAGQKGWLMLLALLMTPVLMVFGFLIGMGIFRISSDLISTGMFYAVSGISGGSNVLVGLIGIIAFSIMIVTAYIFILERSFSLISEFPNRVMMWMGEGINISGGEDRIRAAAAASGVGMNAVGNRMEKPFVRRQMADGSVSSSAQEGVKKTTAAVGAFFKGSGNTATHAGSGGEEAGGDGSGPSQPASRKPPGDA